MTWVDLCLAAIERTAPAGLGEHLAGDLIEEFEFARAKSGERAARVWLTRHTVRACWESLSIRGQRSGWLEGAAAAAFLVALPLAVMIELRRYALTLVPFREGAGMEPRAMAAAALLCTALGAAAGGSKGSRSWPFLAAMVAVVVSGFSAAHAALAGVAALAGAAAAARYRKGDIR